MIKEIVLPSLGEGIIEGTVISLMVKKGDQVGAEQSIIEVETDKVVLEVPIDEDGIVNELLVAEGELIKVGQVIAKIELPAQADPIPAVDPTEQPVIKAETMQSNVVETTPVLPPETTSITDSNKEFRASPLARKLARELGVTIESVAYNGGRVSVKDVKNFVKERNENGVASSNPTNSLPIQKNLPDFSKWGTISKKNLTGIEKATLKNMQYSWATIPHAWISEKVDITVVEKSRQAHKEKVKQAGGSLTITSLLVKACTIALQKHPIFNSSIDTSTEEIIYKDYCNIGVAVDTDRGLIVPVIKKTHLKSITELSQDLAALSQSAKARKTKMEDLEGATFTISNLGGIGSTGIMPIVNSPEVGILGVGASTQEAVWNGIAFEPRLIAPLTIAFDHRVINGADALRFLVTIKELLEDPFLMAL